MTSLPELGWYSNSFEQLARRVPSPVPHRTGNELSFEIKDQTYEATLLLIVAKYVSGLNSAAVLLNHSFLQELGALQRILDEVFEQGLFVAYAVQTQDFTNDHKLFLEQFWEDEPKFAHFRIQPKMKASLPRKRIQSYIASVETQGKPDHNDLHAARYITRIYSGFIHPTAVHLMELWNPSCQKYDVAGVSDHSLNELSASDFQNQLYRGILLIGHTASVLGSEALFDEAMQFERIHLESKL